MLIIRKYIYIMLNVKKVYLLVISLILFTCLFVPSAHSQTPKEFIRLRATAQGTPTTSDLSAGGEAIPQYYMCVGDKIEIYVWQNPDLSKEATIRPDGKLSYPLVGTIQASGLTIDQLQSKITARLSKYIRHPVVTVSIKQSVGSKIIVLGQVNYPGIYTFIGGISVLEAIALAGDFTPDGRRESIMIISDNLTPNPKVRRLDALTALRKGMMTESCLLKPNDVVYVPRSTIADFNKFLNEIAPTINTANNIFQMGTNFYGVAAQTKAWFWHRDLKVIRGD